MHKGMFQQNLIHVLLRFHLKETFRMTSVTSHVDVHTAVNTATHSEDASLRVMHPKRDSSDVTCLVSFSFPSGVSLFSFLHLIIVVFSFFLLVFWFDAISDRYQLLNLFDYCSLGFTYTQCNNNAHSFINGYTVFCWALTSYSVS